MAVVQFHMGLAWAIDTLQRAHRFFLSINSFFCFLNPSTSDSRNLTATKEGVTHMAAVHLHISEVHTTIVDVATSEDTAGIIKICICLEMTVFVSISFVFNLFIVEARSIIVSVTHIAVVHDDMCGSPDSTTLATTIGVALNSWNTIEIKVMRITHRNSSQILILNTDINVSLTRNIF